MCRQHPDPIRHHRRPLQLSAIVLSSTESFQINSKSLLRSSRSFGWRSVVPSRPSLHSSPSAFPSPVTLPWPFSLRLSHYSRCAVPSTRSPPALLPATTSWSAVCLLLGQLSAALGAPGP
ncbi:hypothetical protein CCHR01_01315 [Colletotrichum chrysophilum]|uniref:Uncharacterized protein n=1 Tax=Colletotrichum chrysophilum TaxID=1836956 RepID=A0AAD9AX42_9PEZI|nr:hypothetical protein CCHR01_01315 [Colletotrichum chrysophilum]